MFEFLLQLVKSPLFWLALFAAAFIFASGSQRNTQRCRSHFCIIKKQLVKIAHLKQE